MALFRFQNPALEKSAAAVLGRLPPLAGAAIRIQSVCGLRDRRGPVHGGSFLRERRIVLDCGPTEFQRIFAHELFHFVWFRVGNAARRSYEDLVRAEWRAGARGELGWSAEWRKGRLAPRDIEARSRRWREYCCESFCDAAAALYSGIRSHREFTLAARFRRRRQEWFARVVEPRRLSI
ncbi:MAG: hypothetical protein LAQ30_18740 [Acidobacteriia bacterium]|nr:hypothetical protein [Terriglobia bacterium]